MVRILIFLTIFLSSFVSHAGELEIFAGANSTEYDDVHEANSWGISLRTQYNFSRDASTFMVNINAPGDSLLNGIFSFGYLLRTSGSFFWEAGPAIGYSAIYGPQGELIVGIGYHVTQDFFLDLPVVLGTSTGILLSPYLGFQF
jgi:hypothetical protein